MRNPKSILQGVSRNVLGNELEYDQISQSTMFRSGNNSKQTSSRFIKSPPNFHLSDKSDSLDQLMDGKSKQRRSIFFASEPLKNQRYTYKASSTDFNLEDENKPPPVRRREKTLQQSPQQTQISLPNEVQEFFETVELPQKQIQVRSISKKKELVSFTDWVENIYGKDWFEQKTKTISIKIKKPTTILDIFKVDDNS